MSTSAAPRRRRRDTTTECVPHPTLLCMPPLRKPSSPASSSTSKVLAVRLGVPTSEAWDGRRRAPLALPPRARVAMDMCILIPSHTQPAAPRWARCFTTTQRRLGAREARSPRPLRMTGRIGRESSGRMPSDHRCRVVVSGPQRKETTSSLGIPSISATSRLLSRLGIICRPLQYVGRQNKAAKLHEGPGRPLVACFIFL